MTRSLAALARVRPKEQSRGWPTRMRRALPAFLLFPVAAWSHSFWLVPFGPAVEPGARVALDLRIGRRWPGESTPRLDGMVSSFRVLDGKGSRDVSGRRGATPVGHFDARTSGAAIAVMQTHPSSTVLSGIEFQRYLEEEQLEAALKMRAELGQNEADVREDFSRVAKALVVVGGDSGGFDRVFGLPFELVPLTDPLSHRPGQPFAVRLLLGGRPAAGVRIAALPQRQPEGIVQARTNDQGEVRLALPHGGLWTFHSVHIEPSPRPPSDWLSIWASLTLALPEAAQ